MHLLIKICDGQPIKVKQLLHQYYTTYKRKFATDAGLDLVIPYDYTIGAHSYGTLLHLGICCTPVSSIPHGYYLYPRSSLARTALRLANSVGIIDASYTGEILACVDNVTDHEEVIKVYDGDIVLFNKLFQLCSPDLTPITFELVDSLDETERGSGGFGSTN